MNFIYILLFGVIMACNSYSSIKYNDTVKEREDKLEKLASYRNNIFNSTNNYLLLLKSELCLQSINDEDFDFTMKILSEVDESLFILIELIIQDNLIKEKYAWNSVNDYLSPTIPYPKSKEILEKFQIFCLASSNISFDNAIDYLKYLHSSKF